MRKLTMAVAAAMVMAFGLSTAGATRAADDPPKADAGKDKASDKEKIDLPPFPEARPRSI
jgi:uncharacterized membrane protein